MAKKPGNQNKPWTAPSLKKLEKLVDQNTPPRLIAHELGRSAAAIYAKASDEGISLKPTNQSPYNRRKK